jgi:hypothetical protein
VVGYAAHRHGHALFLVARGERDLQFPGRDFRILEEELIEVAQAEKEKRLRMFLFDGGILPHQRGGGLAQAHGENLAGL